MRNFGVMACLFLASCAGTERTTTMDEAQNALSDALCRVFQDVSVARKISSNKPGAQIVRLDEITVHCDRKLILSRSKAPQDSHEIYEEFHSRRVAEFNYYFCPVIGTSIATNNGWKQIHTVRYRDGVEVDVPITCNSKLRTE